jgi:hypothetical protein
MTTELLVTYSLSVSTVEDRVRVVERRVGVETLFIVFHQCLPL